MMGRGRNFRKEKKKKIATVRLDISYMFPTGFLLTNSFILNLSITQILYFYLETYGLLPHIVFLGGYRSSA